MNYLKCQYSKGMFSHEYVIKFNIMSSPSSCYENWMFVKKEDVIPITEDVGLVKLLGMKKVKDEYMVSIMDVGDHRISRRCVPKQDVFIL